MQVGPRRGRFPLAATPLWQISSKVVVVGLPRPAWELLRERLPATALLKPVHARQRALPQETE